MLLIPRVVIWSLSLDSMCACLSFGVILRLLAPMQMDRQLSSLRPLTHFGTHVGVASVTQHMEYGIWSHAVPVMHSADTALYVRCREQVETLLRMHD